MVVSDTTAHLHSVKWFHTLVNVAIPLILCMKFKTTLSASKILLALPIIKANSACEFEKISNKETYYNKDNIPETVPNCNPFVTLSPSWMVHFTCCKWLNQMLSMNNKLQNQRREQIKIPPQMEQTFPRFIMCINDNILVRWSKKYIDIWGMWVIYSSAFDYYISILINK